MMFALGALACGLLALAFSVMLVRRTRRITEKRLLAAIATRRAEFEAEREELRARHAVELFRLEKEVGRILDMATAHRLESDVKDRDLNALHAELSARDEEIHDLQERLDEQRDLLQDLERRAAEAGTQLRAARHSLKIEVKRRSGFEDQLDEAVRLADEQKSAVTALKAENETLRTILMEYQQAGYTKTIVPHPAAAMPDAAPTPAEEPRQEQAGASVVPLPMRHRAVGNGAVPPLSEEADAEILAIERAVDEVSRLSGEAEAELDELWHAPAHFAEDEDAEGGAEGGEETKAAPARPDGRLSGDLSADLEIPSPPAEADGRDYDELTPEERVFDAIAEIRALKRAAGQAGE